ncbi:hypothetical protein [Pseudomonas sp. 32_A]|uniref:hypothetical protein n=1 Tax=Pseudomonas sp. 32_A TaxID=2813559 RepID=UPI001A9DB79B|nr:hypothetical protein [Pseudomonas sp. 32_A]
MLVLVASAIIPNIMVSPIISAMPYTVGLAHVVIRFVIRLMVGFVIGFMICFVVSLMVGTIISTIAPAAIMTRATMPTTIATVPAATAAVTTAAATVLGIHAGETTDVVGHQDGRCRQDATYCQCQQTFLEQHDAPPLGVASSSPYRTQ